MLRVADHFERTDTGRARRANEDAYFVSAPLFVVADGMGGAQAGEVAAQAAIEVFQGGLHDGPGSFEERLAAMVAAANERVHKLARSDEQLAGMGTTLTAAYLGEDDLAIAHVGDSRLYCMRDGKLEQLTRDHTLVGDMGLAPEEARRHPQRSIITRALGAEDAVKVDHHTWPARPGDVFLVCSDGLPSMVDDEVIADIMRSAGSLKEAGRTLIEAANAAGGRDNITVLLFGVEEVGAAAAAQDTGVHDAVAEAPAAAEEPSAAAAPAAASARRSLPPRTLQPARRHRRIPRPVVGLVVLLVLAGIVLTGGWIASRSVYFVGTDDDGFVTLYRGLPYDLPAGLELYETQYESGVSAASLSAPVRRTVAEHELRSQDDAVDLVRQLEQGRLAGQR